MKIYNYFAKQMNLQEIFCTHNIIGEKWGDEAVDYEMDL